MNKLTKLLSVFVIAGAVGASVAGIAGCAKKDDGNNGGHTHNYTWVDDNNGKCHEHCSVDGCDTPDKPAQDHVWGDDNECDHCGATKPNTENPEGEVAPATADGIVTEWEGGLADITLSETNKTAAIDLSKVKVYYAAGSTKLEKEVPAANYEITVNKGGSAITELTGLKQGHYEIIVETKNVKNSAGTAVTWENFDELDILNPVKANSLVVKDGTLTQVAGVETIKSTWTYEVTRANGDKEDVAAANVTVTGLDTMTAGEKTATLSCTIDGATVTGTVQYTVTRDTNSHTITKGYVFGKADAGAVAVDAEFKQGGTDTILTVKQTGGVVEAHSGKAEESELTENGVTQKFYYRFAFGGGTFQSDKKLHANNRWIDITTTGAGVLTVYYATNGGTDSITESGKRGVGVYSGTMGLYDETTCLGRDTASDKGVHKLVVNIPAAGTYHIGTAGQAAAYFLGVKLDTIVESAGEDVGLPTETEVAGIELSVDKNEADGTTAKVLKSGQKFASWVTGIKQVKWNPVTGVITKEDVADISGATYTLKTQNMAEAIAVTSDTDLTDDMLGEATITVTLDGVSDTYSAIVESRLSGVVGATASLKGDLNTQVETADAKLTLNKTDIEVSVLWTGEPITTGIDTTYVVKHNNVAIETSKEFEIGTHTLTVEITVTDGTTPVTFIKEVELKVTKKPAEGEVTEKTVSLAGAAILKTETGGEVTLTDGKTSAITGSYYVYDGTTKTIVSVNGAKTWKPNASYLQADGSGRELFIDLTEYAGKKVNVIITATSAKAAGTEVKISLGSDSRVLPDQTQAAADITFSNIDGGSKITITCNNSTRYHQIKVVPVDAV